MKFKAQTIHWKATGLEFPGIHQMFGEIYQDLDSAIDTLTENALSLGLNVPSSLEEYCQYMTVAGFRGRVETAVMLNEFLQDNYGMQKSLRELNEIADNQLNLIGFGADIQERDKQHSIYIYKTKHCLGL